MVYLTDCVMEVYQYSIIVFELFPVVGLILGSCFKSDRGVKSCHTKLDFYRYLEKSHIMLNCEANHVRHVRAQRKSHNSDSR